MRVRVLLFVLSVVFLCSCSTQKEIVYFQDADNGSVSHVIGGADIKFQPDDQVSIIVNSKDKELAEMFNLPVVSYRVGNVNTSIGGRSSTYSQQISVYTIDSVGMIDFPVIGKIEVVGMSREELSAHIKGLLIGGGLIKDPIVTVEYMNLTVSVLGEVNKPGRVYVDKDRITVIDAISLAGDLTIYGRRDKVMVMRVDGDDRITYTLDLRSAESIYTSPAYFLRQGDVVYVSPNNMRARQSTVNGNNVLSASFWISLTSLVATITALFIR